jgi:hypothetical protein
LQNQVHFLHMEHKGSTTQAKPQHKFFYKLKFYNLWAQFVKQTRNRQHQRNLFSSGYHIRLYFWNNVTYTLWVLTYSIPFPLSF